MRRTKVREVGRQYLDAGIEPPNTGFEACAEVLDHQRCGAHVADDARLCGRRSRHTGKEAAQIAEDADRDYYMNALEAKEYGLVDEVVEAVYTKKAD